MRKGKVGGSRRGKHRRKAKPKDERLAAERGGRRYEKRCPGCLRGKKSYTSKAFAATVAIDQSKQTGEPLGAYRGSCGFWHIGHPPKRKQKHRRESE